MKLDNIKNKNSYKWIIWGVLALAYVVVFFHRLAAGVVKEDLMSSFDMNATTFGVVGSLYFYAYMFMQIPSGILADALGAKKNSDYRYTCCRYWVNYIWTCYEYTFYFLLVEPSLV